VIGVLLLSINVASCNVRPELRQQPTDTLRLYAVGTSILVDGSRRSG